MATIAIVLAVILVIGAGIGVYAVLAPRKVERIDEEIVRPAQPLQASTEWTHEAGDEFAGLSEAARCDLVFAVATLDDERSRRLLEHALSDPAEAVALAAAHALATTGRAEAVRVFLDAHPGPRAERITSTLALLAPPSTSSG